MKNINFEYPFLVFDKCSCTKQNPVTSMSVEENENGLQLTYKIICETCEKEISRSYDITSETLNLSNNINVFKIMPSIKDEVSLVKLDTFKCKIKNDRLSLYGNYSHLRFFDNVIENNDIIPVKYVEA